MIVSMTSDAIVGVGVDSGYYNWSYGVDAPDDDIDESRFVIDLESGVVVVVVVVLPAGSESWSHPGAAAP
jgi:hypothetical protein